MKMKKNRYLRKLGSLNSHNNDNNKYLINEMRH